MQQQQSHQSQHVALQAPVREVSSQSGVQSLSSNIKTRKRWADMEDEDGLANLSGLGLSLREIHDSEEPSDGSDWDAPPAQSQGSILEIQAGGPDSEPDPGESSSAAQSESSEGEPRQRVWSSRAKVAATPKQLLNLGLADKSRCFQMTAVLAPLC